MVVISRRRVLQAVPAAAVATAVTAAGAGTAAAAKAPVDPLSRSRWTALVGSSFSAKSTASTWTGRLSAVNDLPGSPSSDRCYALHFTSTTGSREDTYGVSRSGFTTTPLHLVPGPTGKTWTAVVNRL